MKQQLRLFWTAIQFYTRIPVPKSTGYSRENQGRSIVYLPLVGLLVGAVGSIVYLAAQKALPVGPSTLMAMVATLLLTGAFHEDAIADFCDGFGGGNDRETILRIMKDSRIGTFGAVGLCTTLLFRYTSLSEIPSFLFPIVFMGGNTFSRFLPVWMIASSKYLRENRENKAGDVSSDNSRWKPVKAFPFALIPLFFLPWQIAGGLLLLEILTFFTFRWYVHRRLGGYTGDVLGALQQVSELVFYLGFILLNRL